MDSKRAQLLLGMALHAEMTSPRAELTEVKRVRLRVGGDVSITNPKKTKQKQQRRARKKNRR